MSKIVVVLFLISSCFATTVGNFAPLYVGSKWIYSYNSTKKGDLGYSVYCDSGIIEIETLSKRVDGIDTLLLLNIKETYRSIGSGIGYPTYDSIIHRSFIDSVIITGDSIRKARGYRCVIFPFWITNTIDSADLRKDGVGKDSLHYFTIQTSSTHNIYLQNVGLYFSDFNWGSSVNWDHTIIQLKSFNDHEIALKAGQHRKTVRKVPFVKRKATLSLSHQIVRGSTYSLSGQRLVTGIRKPVGIVITNDLKAENKGK